MVKCVDCGFLAIRHRREGGLAEADEFYRKEGMPEMGTDQERWPVCFVRAWPLRSEVVQAMLSDQMGTHAPSPPYVARVIQAERECPPGVGVDGFVPWRQGFTPKEHQEMLDRDWRLKFQAEREDADRKWRDEQRQKDEQWREAQDKEADERHAEQMRILSTQHAEQMAVMRGEAEAERSRHRTGIIVTGVLATIALVAATIVSAYIQRGYFLTPPSTSTQAPVIVPPPNVVVNNILPTAAPSPTTPPTPPQSPG